MGLTKYLLVDEAEREVGAVVVVVVAFGGITVEAVALLLFIAPI